MRALLIIKLLVIIGLPLFGQRPLSKQIQLDSQLGKARISKSFVDHKGFLWLGTDRGLFLFDGQKFTSYAHTDTVVNSTITALYQDQNYRLWIGYDSGNIDFLDEDALHIWNIQEGLPKAPITGFCSDTFGTFWIATYGEGLYSFRDDLLYNFNTDDGLSSNEIYCMAYHHAGKVWLGTDGGVNICSWENDEKSIEQHGMDQGIPDEIILSICIGDSDEVWLGTHDYGFGIYDEKEKSYYSPLSDWTNGPINKILTSKDNLYIATESNGLYSFDLSKSSLLNISQYIVDTEKSITDLSIDHQKNLWMVSHQSSLTLINDQFEYYDLNVDLIQALCHNENDAIWIGTSTGLFKNDLSGDHLALQKHIPDRALNIISLDIDDFGQLWIGTFGQGLFCYDPTNDKLMSIDESSGLLNNSILSVQCQKNEVWLASLGGASKITLNGDVFAKAYTMSPKIDEVGSDYIYHIFTDSQNRIWFATDGQGLSCLENGNVRKIKISDLGKPVKTVYSVTEDLWKNIWCISSEGNVFYQKEDQFVRFDKIKPGLDLSGILASRNGEIIISYHDGLIIIDPKSHRVSYLSEEFELSNLQPNLNTLEPDNFGNIWIGANNRLICFKGVSSFTNIPPQTHITRISLFDKPVFETSPFLFKAKENFISFNYVGLSYLAPQKIRYQYMLDGYERAWNETRDQRVSYSHLPAGDYTFKVQSSVSDQFENLPIESISFNINKAIYNRVGFWVFVVLLGYRIIYLISKSRERKLRMQAIRKREQIEFKYHQLQSQINPHFLFNSYNTLLNIIEEKPEVASEYVENLSDFYRKIITLKDKDLITLDEEIELVNNYFYLLQNRYGNNIRLEIDLNSTSKFVAPLSLQMLVENAVKHNVISKKYPLQISINDDQNAIMVKNNLQPKINNEKSSGFGLKNIKERYAILSDQPIEIIESESEFIVLLPFINKNSYV